MDIDLYLIKQPNGLIAGYSLKSKEFLRMNATEEKFRRLLTGRFDAPTVERLIEAANKDEDAPFSDANAQPGSKRWEGALVQIKEAHGRQVHDLACQHGFSKVWAA